ncbi:hypothetical protein [uncultured Bacteroides sp.]|uniref:hypothetical protein n=1 Tax=uncultured Bacteroides sp. TaxID=162156 RepID=UPI002AABED48|nr:hypothetical protein [uncultured Bacteroides sp.]
MEEKTLTEKESIEIISRMIQETKEGMREGSGNMFLLWGYVATIVSLIIYFGYNATGNSNIFWLWWLIPAIGWPVMIYMLKRKKKRVVTYVDKVIGYIWTILGVCAMLVPIFSFTQPIGTFPILFMEALLINIGVTMTGMVIKYKLLIVSGFIGILFSFMLLFVHGLSCILVFAAMFVVLMIIPGHVLNAASRKSKKYDLCSEN